MKPIVSVVKKTNANENSSVTKTEKNVLMVLSKCSFCGKKKSTFITFQELSNFNNFGIKLKTNKIINKFSLTGDNDIPEFHLKLPVFPYSACGPFRNHRERTRPFRETGTLKHLYRNEFHNACFAHDARYSDSKGLAKRAISDKILKDKADEIARNCNYDRYQKHCQVWPIVFFFFFDQKTRSGVSINQKLAEELHRAAIKKFKRRKNYARFKDNIWAEQI